MRKNILIALSVIILFLVSCDNEHIDDYDQYHTELNGVMRDEPESEESSYSLVDYEAYENLEFMNIELLDFREALEIFGEGIEADVLDIETGITYRVRRVIGGYNTLADVETMTLEDTNRLLETAGGEWNVRRRAVIVTIEGRHIAASIAPFPHSGSEDYPFGMIIDNRSGATGTGINLDSIRGNEMIGVVDIFFFNSMIPGINRVDERHQEMVLMAYDFEG
ncbi:MAG: hypothetical protein FWD05_07275 [Oscillospiraceae bacterium]|nr:hypothetical protein [Oscillospiraceae bacterium]